MLIFTGCIHSKHIKPFQEQESRERSLADDAAPACIGSAPVSLALAAVQRHFDEERQLQYIFLIQLFKNTHNTASGQ